MTLVPGTRLGSYEVVAPVGAGGMGEVYRARDTKLQRDVAIKVLPDLFARDPERLARFEREARVLAALNHPNVAHIYGVESGALVMEFVDGDDLAQRMARSGRMPLDEAVPIAMQVAEALESAHELGIIHRDLKPANIKVRPDGTVKVLDFGLAKALAPADGSSVPAAIENSPTITSPYQMSQLGVILGTAAYMAPEQAKGKPVDKRVDIWAFGCVLFEMLSGRRPFDGEDVTDTLAAIVRADPDWSRLPADVPAPLRTLLRRCLQKDRRERLPDIGAARLELSELRAGQELPQIVPPLPRRSSALPWALCAASSIVAIAALAYALMPRAPVETRVVKALIMPQAPLSGAPALRLSVSPDGRRLAFVAPDETGRTVLWVRPLDTMTAQPLAGTGNALAPFWSPDSRWIAFLADGKLKKVEAVGGAVLTLCDAGGAPPGAWNARGVIIFSGPGGLAQVRDSGGTPTPVTNFAATGSTRHISPFFLPDGRHFLFAASAAGTQSPGVYVGSLDSKEVTRVLEGSTNPAYGAGHMLFMRGSTLVAQPFDPATFALSGDPVTLAEGVQTNPATGTGAFAISQTGVLIYQTGESMGTQLAWYDRTGKQVSSVGPAALYRDVQLSPDGRYASFTVGLGTQADIWIHDVERNLRRAFTFGNSGQGAIWSHDGRFLVYAHRRDQGLDLRKKAADGLGSEEVLLNDGGRNLPLHVSSDGRFLIYSRPSESSLGDLWLLPLDGERKPRRLLAGTDREMAAAISPDGRWLAYTGSTDVFVTSFPGVDGKWQISSGGGHRPVWSRSGKELFFMNADRFMAAEINAVDKPFESGPVRQLFDVRVPATTLGTRATFAVARDAQRFLVNTWDVRNSQTPIALVVHWPKTLKK